jgi:hypothetical protein
MRRTVVMAAATLALTFALPVFSQAAVTTNVKEPLAFVVSNPCANDGAGEDVPLTGTLHTLITATEDKGGGFHINLHFTERATGVGLTTGATYQASGIATNIFNAKVGQVSTLVNTLRLIGQGPGNNLLIHEIIHLTINANGVVTAEFFRASQECK